VCIGHNIQGAAVGYFAGLDVSLEETAICIADDTGQIMREARVTSEPAALVAFFAKCGLTMERSGWRRARWQLGSMPG
jgi:transposase